MGYPEKARAISKNTLASARLDSLNNALLICQIKMRSALYILRVGNPKLALAEMETALLDLEQLDPGANASDKNAILQLQAILLYKAGHFAESEKILRPLLQFNLDNFGIENLRTVTSGVCLGLVLQELNKTSESNQLFAVYSDKFRNLPLAEPILLDAITKSTFLKK